MTEPSGSHHDAHDEGTEKISNDPLVLAILPMVVLAAALSLLARIRNVQRLTSVTPAEVL